MRWGRVVLRPVVAEKAAGGIEFLTLRPRSAAMQEIMLDNSACESRVCMLNALGLWLTWGKKEGQHCKS
jgi:hypothetical protein